MIWITTIVLCLKAFPGLHHYERCKEMLLRPPLAPAGVRFWWADPGVSTSPWGSLATQGSRFTGNSPAVSQATSLEGTFQSTQEANVSQQWPGLGGKNLSAHSAGSEVWARSALRFRRLTNAESCAKSCFLVSVIPPSPLPPGQGSA